MNRLKNFLNQLRFRNHTVQYELQRMTQKGGWKDYGGGAWGEPLSADTDLIVSEGRFRCIRRVDGRIHEVLWTRETPDADAEYDEERMRDEQRELMRTLSLEELRDEWVSPDRLSALPRSEIDEFYEQKQDETDQGVEHSRSIQYPEIDVPDRW